MISINNIRLSLGNDKKIPSFKQRDLTQCLEKFIVLSVFVIPSIIIFVRTPAYGNMIATTDDLSFSTTGQSLYGSGNGTKTLQFSHTLANLQNLTGTISGTQAEPNPAYTLWQGQYDANYSYQYGIVYAADIAYCAAHPLKSQCGLDTTSNAKADAATQATAYAISETGPAPAQTLSTTASINATNGSLQFGINGKVSVSALGGVNASYDTVANLSIDHSSVVAGQPFTISLTQTPQKLALSSGPPTIAASIGDSFSTSGTIGGSLSVDGVGASVQGINIPQTSVDQNTLMSASVSTQTAEISVPIANFSDSTNTPSFQNHQFSVGVPIPEQPEFSVTVPVANMSLQLPTLQSDHQLLESDISNQTNPTIASTVGPSSGGTICTSTFSKPCSLEPTDFASVGLNVPFLVDAIVSATGNPEFDPLGPGGIGIKVGVPGTPLNLGAQLDYLTYFSEALLGLSQNLNWDPGLDATLEFSHAVKVKIGNGPDVLTMMADIRPGENITITDPLAGSLAITPVYNLNNNEFTNTTSLYARFQQDFNFAGYTRSLLTSGNPVIALLPSQWYLYTATINTGNPITLHSFNLANYSLGGFMSQTGGSLQVLVRPVPEPSTIYIFVGGLVLIEMLRRKKKASNR